MKDRLILTKPEGINKIQNAPLIEALSNESLNVSYLDLDEGYDQSDIEVSSVEIESQTGSINKTD